MSLGVLLHQTSDQRGGRGVEGGYGMGCRNTNGMSLFPSFPSFPSDFMCRCSAFTSFSRHSSLTRSVSVNTAPPNPANPYAAPFFNANTFTPPSTPPPPFPSFFFSPFPTVCRSVFNNRSAFDGAVRSKREGCAVSSFASASDELCWTIIDGIVSAANVVETRSVT